MHSFAPKNTISTASLLSHMLSAITSGLIRITAVFLIVVLGMTGCDYTGFQRVLDDNDPIDRELALHRSDYRDMYDMEKKPITKTEHRHSNAGRVPDFAPVLAAPRPPKIGETKLVSVAVTDDVPLKDVLIELSKLADVDLELDANISGGISFRAKDRPFSEVIERIADLGGLRYSYAGGVLRIERDLPYIQNYPIDFLNLVRSSNSNVSITTDVLAIAGSAVGDGAGGNSGLTTGSSTTIDTQAVDDFWESLEMNIRSILMHESPSFLADNQPAQSQPVSASAASTDNGTSADAAASTDTQAAADVVDPMLNDPNRIGNNMFFVLNRQAGIISIAATKRQHDSVEQYLHHLKRNATAQVLIEAKVVEVQLDDAFQSGINWSLVSQSFGGSGTFDFDTTFGPEVDRANLFRISLNSNDPAANLGSVIDLTERFGTTRTLSNPRLHAINNQPAVLTFAENRVFFEVELESEPDTTDATGAVREGQLTIETERRSIPIGIILTILPSINLEENEVTLNVRPTLTRQVDEVVDPGSAFASQILIPNAEDRFTNTVPIVEVRELDSIMRLKSGEIMVIGGLMEQVANNSDAGIPFISEVPFLGNMFKGVDKRTSNTELVIFIRATIVTPQGNYNEADKRIYQKFTNDPRPIAF